MKRWIGSSGSIANVKWLGLAAGLAFMMLLQGCVTHTQVRSGYGNGYGGYNGYSSHAYPMVVHRPAPVYVYSPPPRVIYYNTPVHSPQREVNSREHRQHHQAPPRQQDRRELDKHQRKPENQKERRQESNRDNHTNDRASRDSRRSTQSDTQRAALPAQTRPALIQALKPERTH